MFIACCSLTLVGMHLNLFLSYVVVGFRSNIQKGTSESCRGNGM